MANPFTPEQISQILEEFFKVVGTRQYIGARYVPIFGRKGEESIEWDNTAPYEPLTIVLYQGNSYTSRQFVPVGVEITNQEFWAITGNYNAQVEQYRRETAAAREVADNALAAAGAAQTDIDTLLPKADFSSENTVKYYIDAAQATANNAQNDIDTLLPKTDFSAENTVKKYVDDAMRPKVAGFSTVNEMIASDNLYVNANVHTDGFNTTGEGGAWYKIVANATANNMDVIASGELFAILQDSAAFIDVSQYGVDLTGDADASGIIQYVIDKYPHATIYFPNGNYKLLNTVKTWPDNDRYVNLVFAPNANFFTTSNLECLFYIGGYDLDANYGTTATLGHKKFFYGGRFDGTNCEYAIKMASGTCDQQFMNCVFYNCNSGILMGHVTRERSIDSVIAYCNFIGTGAADSFGVRYMKPDNKIQHCRIYGFKTCISCAEGGLYAFDIHTLDMSRTPEGYSCEDSCVVDLPTGGRNTLIAVYGNGEGTFLRLHGEYVNLIKVIACEYRNWTLDASHFIFINILNDGYGRIHGTVSGNTVIADNPNDTGRLRYGIRGMWRSDDLAVADNVLWGIEHLSDRGDPICLVDNLPIRQVDIHVMETNHWYYIGSMKMGPFNKEYNIEFNIGLVRIGFSILAHDGTSPIATYGKYAISPYVPNIGKYYIGYIRNGTTLDWYVYSETATPAFSAITAYVREVGKRYYMAFIYKDRVDDTGYSQKELGGPIDTFQVTQSYEFNMQPNNFATL